MVASIGQDVTSDKIISSASLGTNFITLASGAEFKIDCCNDLGNNASNFDAVQAAALWAGVKQFCAEIFVREIIQ